MPDFIPRSDGAFLAWAANYTGLICAEPAFYGVSPEDSALLAEKFELFAAAFALTSSDGTRTPVAIRTKDQARAELTTVARRLASRARGSGVVRAIRIKLGIQTGKGRDAPRSKIPAPTGRPIVSIRSVNGSRVSILLLDPESPSRRAKGFGILGVRVFTFIGDVPPASLSECRMHMQITRTDGVLDFGSKVPPGTVVWIYAQWLGSRCQGGPIGNPTSARLNYSAPVEEGGLKRTMAA